MSFVSCVRSWEKNWDWLESSRTPANTDSRNLYITVYSHRFQAVFQWLCIFWLRARRISGCYSQRWSKWFIPQNPPMGPGISDKEIFSIPWKISRKWMRWNISRPWLRSSTRIKTRSFLSLRSMFEVANHLIIQLVVCLRKFTFCKFSWLR